MESHTQVSRLTNPAWKQYVKATAVITNNANVLII